MQKEPSALACDIANPFPPDLWGYVHGFGHKLGIISKPQHTIKARSLEATLPAIILIRDVFSRVTAGAGHHQEGAGVRVFPWYKERRGACIGSSTPLKIEQHHIPTSLSSDTFDSQWPYSAEALPVTPNGPHLRWLDLCQSQLLRPPSYGCSWHGRVVVNDAQSVLNGAQPVIDDTSTMTT